MGIRDFTIVLLLFGAVPALSAEDRVRVPIHERMSAVSLNGRELYLEVTPEKGMGYIALADRYCSNTSHWKTIKARNRSKRVVLGEQYLIPFQTLKPLLQRVTIEAIFSKDTWTEAGWYHRVILPYDGNRGETLWRISEWFTGSGQNYRQLLRINGLSTATLTQNQEIHIPPELLTPFFHQRASPLAFLKDAKGAYAVYSLKKGEALYSDVVVRFTDSVEADEVNRLADAIAQRSEITDPTDIPIDYPVKIPLEFLAPEFRPLNDPKRIEYELSLQDSLKYRPQVHTTNLKGIHVIVDAGHGGVDRGAFNNGVWESDYVYDIMARIKRRIETKTAATFHPIIRDSSFGFRVFEASQLTRNQKEYIVTTPPFSLDTVNNTRTAVHLRWYLSNYLFKKLQQEGVDPHRIVFTSLHADSLHPSVRGLMIYFPGQQYRRTGRIGKTGPVYQQILEARTYQHVSLTRTMKARSEGLSREFARTILQAFRDSQLPIHRYQPIRDHIVRRRRSWVPAILRYNIVPTKVLIEVCNIKNQNDSRLLRSPQYRETVAAAYVNALISFFDQRPPDRTGGTVPTRSHAN